MNTVPASSSRSKTTPPENKGDPIRIITIGGVAYHCTLTSHFRRHNQAEHERMKAGAIKLGGIHDYPVLLYTDETLNLENCVLDGEGRLETAAEMGIVPECKHVGQMTTARAKIKAEVYNDARRHEDEEAIAARRQRVAAGKAAGKSPQAIAEEEGVSCATVRRDLEKVETPVQGGPGGHPERVKGKDGKSYPATKPPSKKELEPPADEIEPPVNLNFDETGFPIPQELRDLFANGWMHDEVKRIEKLVQQLRSSTTWLAWLKPQAFADGEAFARGIGDAIPYAVCRKCEGKKCNECNMSGHLPKHRHEHLEYQKGAKPVGK